MRLPVDFLHMLRQCGLPLLLFKVHLSRSLFGLHQNVQPIPADCYVPIDKDIINVLLRQRLNCHKTVKRMRNLQIFLKELLFRMINAISSQG